MVRPPPRLNDNGFTLVEVTVATSILGILTIATMLTLIPMSRQNRISRESTVALAEVRNVLERIHATSFSRVLEDFPPGIDLPIEGLDDGSITVSYVDPAADPLEIQLDLTWSSPDQGTLNRSFFTLRTE